LSTNVEFFDTNHFNSIIDKTSKQTKINYIELRFNSGIQEEGLSLFKCNFLQKSILKVHRAKLLKNLQ